MFPPSAEPVEPKKKTKKVKHNKFFDNNDYNFPLDHTTPDPMAEQWLKKNKIKPESEKTKENPFRIDSSEENKTRRHIDKYRDNKRLFSVTIDEQGSLRIVLN